MSIARDLAKLRTPVQLANGGTGKTSIGEAAVGTVSQTGGIPTGAIIESYIAGGRRIIKYADGTMIVHTGSTGGYVSSEIPANTLSGIVNITLPVSFVDQNYFITSTVSPSNSNDHFGVTNIYPTANNTIQAIIRNGSVAQTFSIRLMAIGRWY